MEHQREQSRRSAARSCRASNGTGLRRDARVRQQHTARELHDAERAGDGGGKRRHQSAIDQRGDEIRGHRRVHDDRHREEDDDASDAGQRRAVVETAAGTDESHRGSCAPTSRDRETRS